jgi:PhnB protein
VKPREGFTRDALSAQITLPTKETPMPVKPIPDGYNTVTTYLTVQNANGLIEFLKKAFGAKEIMRMSQPDGTVGHAEIRVGDTLLMLGEPMGEMKSMPAAMYVYVDDTDTTYKRALAAGAASVREPRDEFYGDRVGGVKDSFGNLWWIATHVEDVSPQDLKKRAADMFMKQKTTQKGEVFS